MVVSQYRLTVHVSMHDTHVWSMMIRVVQLCKLCWNIHTLPGPNKVYFCIQQSRTPATVGQALHTMFWMRRGSHWSDLDLCLWKKKKKIWKPLWNLLHWLPWSTSTELSFTYIYFLLIICGDEVKPYASLWLKVHQFFCLNHYGQRWL